MWFKDKEHNISALKIFADLGDNDQQTADIQQNKTGSAKANSELLKI
jgi:hypothetical protein